jgi:hypothetical protein
MRTLGKSHRYNSTSLEPLNLHLRRLYYSYMDSYYYTRSFADILSKTLESGILKRLNGKENTAPYISF